MRSSEPFIASHAQPNQFPEESAFHLAVLKAGVQYVVRISMTAQNVRPDCPAYYPRTHWAIEALLQLGPGRGPAHTPRLSVPQDVQAAPIDPDEVGIVAAHLLSQADTSRHNKANYALNGPEDVTGEHIMWRVEQYIGTRVESVVYKDMSLADGWAKAAGLPANTISTQQQASKEPTWAGKCTAFTTSNELLELAAPTRTAVDALRALVGE
ncbi:hypothetical protein N657DRAFT_674838 [Parathielavia appendiculata]|uniref:NmrA-like domain-containing protein n=1 Tax=Parathielavia appendiculata TaxID=2587402 RepID=A0AAN6TSC3_9PEZI|nr:hypothetical protein N657DRAFT_674838 [Parathielavia appendiculata]